MEDSDLAGRLGVAFGLKLVRGAYLEHERLTARRLGLPDPVNESYASTNATYNKWAIIVFSMLIDINLDIIIKVNIYKAIDNEFNIKLKPFFVNFLWGLHQYFFPITVAHYFSNNYKPCYYKTTIVKRTISF